MAWRDVKRCPLVHAVGNRGKAARSYGERREARGAGSAQMLNETVRGAGDACCDSYPKRSSMKI